MTLQLSAPPGWVESVTVSSDLVSLVEGITLEKLFKCFSKRGMHVAEPAKRALLSMRNAGSFEASGKTLLRFAVEMVQSPCQLSDIQRTLAAKYYGAYRTFNPYETINVLYQAALDEELDTLQGNLLFWNCGEVCPWHAEAIFGLTNTVHGITLDLHRPHASMQLPCHLAFSTEEYVRILKQKRHT